MDYPQIGMQNHGNNYFATSSIKYALAGYMGNLSKDQSKYGGISLENLIASKIIRFIRS